MQTIWIQTIDAELLGVRSGSYLFDTRTTFPPKFDMDVLVLNLKQAKAAETTILPSGQG